MNDRLRRWLAARPGGGVARPWLPLALVASLVLGVGFVAAESGILPASDPSATAGASPTDGSAAGAGSSHAAPASATADPSASASAAAAEAVSYNENAGGAGGRNIVSLMNRVDGRLSIKGSIQLNRIPGPTIEPVNLARAVASCVDCQTLAVAMQVNLISRATHRATPQNAAVALNVECLRCRTIAVALQYTYSVDDPMAVPADVRALIREMDRELRAIASEPGITLATAIPRINAIIARFSTLARSLDDQRDEATEVTSPTEPPASASPSAGPTSEPAATAEPTAAPTTTLEPSPTTSP